MNSAIEPLLKAVNDLKNEVDMLQAEKRELIRRITQLENDVYSLSNKVRASDYTYTRNSRDYTPYWNSLLDNIPNAITNLSNNSNWTLTITYADGSTQTISSTI